MEKPDLQPTLTSQLLTVRPLRQQDWPDLYAVAADKALWALHPKPDRYKEHEFRQFFLGAMTSGSAFAVLDNKTGQLCGSSRYHGYAPELNDVEIGWTFLGRAYWGGIYNRELKRLMLDHAFNMVGKVIFWVGESNLRSRRAMEKIGGVLQPGVHRRAATGDAPYVIYAIDRAVYQLNVQVCHQ